MELNQKDNQLHVYSINESEYIGAIKASFNSKFTNYPIVILDCSSAAGDVAARFVKDILPLVTSEVKNWNTDVELITFGEKCVHRRLSGADPSELDVNSGGAANFGPAIEKLRLYIEAHETISYQSISVLTISAGEISDHEDAARETNKLTDFLSTSAGWRINSQAVRLFTKSNDHQPDTKALSYLLQIDNSTEVNFCDINSTSPNEMIAKKIAALFPENDTKRALLHTENESEKPSIVRFPYKSPPCHFFTAMDGWNIFWLKQLLSTDALVLYSHPNQPVNVVVEGQLTLEKFQQLIGKMLPQILSHLKVLKIVGTAEANESVDQIFSYFEKTEDALAIKCSTRNTKVLTDALAGIAMYKPDFRDAAEMIEFFRGTTKQ